jgi:hypothetical protein
MASTVVEHSRRRAASSVKSVDFSTRTSSARAPRSLSAGVAGAPPPSESADAAAAASPRPALSADMKSSLLLLLVYTVRGAACARQRRRKAQSAGLSWPSVTHISFVSAS